MPIVFDIRLPCCNIFFVASVVGMAREMGFGQQTEKQTHKLSRTAKTFLVVKATNLLFLYFNSKAKLDK